jgi:hypothetical protein
MEISSYVYEMMIRQNQEALAQEYGLLPFTIQVLDIKRTLCEKIMSLVRFSYEPDPIVSLRNKIRHTYDIHKLLQLPEMQEFFNSEAFDVMLLTVGHDDIDSFRNNNEWLHNHPSKALIFRKIDEVWLQLQATYTSTFADLVYGKLPDPLLIIKDIKRVGDRLQTIEWNLEF